MKDDGGSAYPCTCGSNVRWGKTLLDDFAGQAMQILLQIEPTTSKILSNPNGRKYAEWISSDAYNIAEAMVKEKRRREERMKHIIGVDPAAGEDYTAEAVIKNGQIISVGLFKNNSQDKEFQKVHKELQTAIIKRFMPNLREGRK